MLAIEIDGSSHDYKAIEDLQHQKKIDHFGITFIRFDDIEVKKNIDDVVQKIQWQIN